MIRRRLLLAGVVVAAAATAVGYGTSQGAQPTVEHAAPQAERTYTVTLLTGDVVTVHTRGSGCPGVSVRPVQPNSTVSTTCGPDGHVLVVPSSAAALVGRVLDEDLFDVTTLIKEGYDDASSPDLPLIVRGGATRALAGGRALPSIGAVAVRQPKSAGFLGALTLSARSSDSQQVWLDHRVRATRDTTTGVDANLRQVRAPQAWAAGHTGAGVRVAVLDTGADPTHPDLAGKIVEKADFTVDGGDAVDHFGHGTHVAATIASGGAHRGVAPDAQLVIGKVLDDYGSGTESQIIAGMEWAAPRARVVNMSLGGDPTDGTDPMAQAVEQLTRQYGTLFVVAAGNSGPEESTVSTPATAPAALAVGAVDGTDKLADFSSRGPVVGSRVLKPEIVAPGVDIVAARAAGTTMGTPVDARYTRASGTSMAAPHVAGAAAIVAQLHPDWDATKLKAALVGAAEPVDGDPYERGAGRLDVARATGSVVSSTATVDLGTFAYPPSGTAETKVGWTNTGDKAVRLNLSVRLTDRYGKTTTNPALALSDTKVTVPAGGGASAVLRLDRARFDAGLYTATVTATWPGGTATTPVAFYAEPPSYDLTVAHTPPPGASPDSVIDGWVMVVNLDDPALFYTFEPLSDNKLRVPAGRYSIMGSVLELTPDTYDSLGSAMAGDPDVTVSSDTTVTLDAAAAKPVVATVDGVDTTTSQLTVAYLQHLRRGPEFGALLSQFNDFSPNGRLYATPTEGVGVGSLVGYESFVLDSADLTKHYDLIRKLPGRIPDDVAYRVTAAEHARLARIDQRFQTLDTPGGKPLLRRLGETDDGLWLIEEFSPPTLPVTRVDYVSPEGVWTDSGGTRGIGQFGVAFVEPRQRYAAGSRQEKVWVRQPLRPDWSTGESNLSPCLPAPVVRTATLLRVQLVELTDQHNRITCLGPDDPDWGPKAKRTMTLYRNGTAVATEANAQAEFPLRKEKANYRLTYDLDASALMAVSTKVNTEWTFTSAAPPGTADAPVPLLSVDYALPLDASNHPKDGAAGFTVRQAPGTTPQAVTRFQAWTSVDDGTTWTPVDVQKVAGNRFSAHLPQVRAGQAVSLRIAVAANGGSGMEQTIIRAYRAA